ncbi:MAG: hypothetical protein D6732_29285 [Methanobacteriota archaeon]|nr:MAG: hypothetical protein D6732_29285 [Euryarchaeota archaeon]
MINVPVLIIVSQTDLAGMNMLDTLLRLDTYSEVEFSIPDSWKGDNYRLLKNQRGTKGILLIPHSQIHTDYLKGHISTNLLIFASKHSSKAGMKAVLVHTTGNWSDPWQDSGSPRTLAIAPAFAIYEGYHSLKRHLGHSSLTDYWVGMECTHHGPTDLDVPVLYMECGGTETEWKDTDATAVVGHAIDDVANTFIDPPEETLKAAIGIGGGHYCPAFVKRLDARMFYMGHVAPKHVHNDLDEEMIIQAWNRTQAKERFFLIDRKGTRGPVRRMIIDVCEKHGFPWAYTTDFPTSK